MEHYVT